MEREPTGSSPFHVERSESLAIRHTSLVIVPRYKGAPYASLGFFRVSHPLQNLISQKTKPIELRAILSTTLVDNNDDVETKSLAIYPRNGNWAPKRLVRYWCAS